MFEAMVKHGILIAVGTLIVIVLGIVAALKIPVQMIPDLEVRTISIRTNWPGATPQDVEKEILIEQEEHLRSVRGLQRFVSSASFGRAQVELEFPFGINLNDTLIEVINALSRVPSYPNNVDEPRIYATSFSANSFMYFRVMPLPGNPRNLDMIPMQDFIKDHVAVRMETVPGVSEISVYGGAERQIQILIDPTQLAERNLTVTQVRNAVQQRNRDVSGGEIESGKRRYLLRTIGRVHDVEDLKEVIVDHQGDALTRLGEIAEIRLGHFEITRYSYTDGSPVIGMSVRRQAGSNVIDIKRAMMPEVEAINEEVLIPAGMQMFLVADDVGYVEASIYNVWTNLLIGAVLASIVMFLFLRTGKVTLIGVMGIPICTIAAFMGLVLAGRTINVISLAGVAFAIGMTLDNSIVVLESIELSWRKGLDRWQAAIDGARKVWPAVLASTLTTVLVFVPIVFIAEEAGQLYSDVAIAISASIIASMLVAIVVIPAAAAHVFSGSRERRFANRVDWKEFLIKRVEWIVGTRMHQLGVLAVVIGICGAIIVYLTPPAEYLPEGEEPKLFASMSPPTGYNLETMTRIGHEVQEYFMPFLDHNPSQFDRGETEVPAMAYFNLSIQATRLRIIAQPKDPKHIKPLMDAVDRKYERYVGMRSFVSRGSIITSNSGGTRSINLDISGPSLQTIYAVATRAESRAKEVFEKPRVRSQPASLTLSQPLIEIRPNWERLAQSGISNADMGFTIAALTDGAFVDEFFLEDDKIDIYLYSSAGNNASLESLHSLPIYTPTNAVVPLASLARIVESVDTSNIRRVDGKRTVTLSIIPPDNIALETGLEIVKRDVVTYLQDSGAVPSNVKIIISGASDQLQATRESLAANYLVALVIIYLVLVAIFSHWGYPLLIMTTIPLGIASGLVGLWLMNQIGAWLPAIGYPAMSQPFDMITMLGFLILMGTVVNNPILIVHQAMVNVREHNMAAQQAVRDAVAIRLRPIAMTTLTTVCGLAPLVLIPGEGTELYRGVGVIVLCGLVGTAIVTLTFLPALTMVALFFHRSPKPPSVISDGSQN
ncbi:MAG: efflux RND transporter permease subunit [Candidatus Thiodiazotropha sp.]|nr:efflux RND transporter permease subunit [Candidatus Thiodiazotropha sp.]MCM8883842.1 efflux RND transporter permease subunit [Candidatus Thiodiazotropha sp.]MCM8918531.1 efflux RND transporter permease subunit [Candidatus Thiodiazotropha sp.]